MKYPRRSYRHRTAFTLIELLVVISIIALLVAILMPALNSARQQAKLVVCGSNQHQLVVGLLAYASDNEGKLPISTSWNTMLGLSHRPFELNWYRNSFRSYIGVTKPADYVYTGMFLYKYLPQVDVFNCTVSPIDGDSEWPPNNGNPMDSVPKGTYQYFYETGNYDPLHATYQLLWSYQGYAKNSPRANQNVEKFFDAPTNMGSKNKLVVQDSFFYLTSNQNILWNNPQNSWYSCHPFKGSSKGVPYFSIKADNANEVFQETLQPKNNLNAGYLDGSVRRFESTETYRVMNVNAWAWITKEFK